MMRLLKIARNILVITLPAVIVTLLVLEIGLRLFVPVSDTLPPFVYDYEANVVISEPNLTGTLITPAYTARYNINAQGWNSPHNYEVEKADDVVRVAVIGDSYIEAFQVDFDQNFPALLSQRSKDVQHQLGVGKGLKPHV